MNILRYINLSRFHICWVCSEAINRFSMEALLYLLVTWM